MSGNIDANPGVLNYGPTLVEGRHRGGFLVREANGYRSRDLGTLTNSGAASVMYPAGLVVEVATAQNGSTPAAVAPYTTATAAGTAGAILYDNYLVAAGATAKVTLVSREAEVNGAELMFDASVTTPAQQATILTALRNAGLIAR